MSKVNLTAIKEHVRTQYGDLTGVIQIDGHSNVTSLYDLCLDYGFQTEGIFIVGFGFNESTINGIGKRDKMVCSIFYVIKSESGNNFEEISNTINKTVTSRIKRKNIYIEYSKIGKYIKRFDFIAFTEILRNVNTIEIDEEQESD